MKTSLGVLVTSRGLPRAGQLALQHAVPQQVLEPLLVEPHLLHRALDPLVSRSTAEVAQVDLVRAVDLRVAVEQHAQQRRARAQRAHDEAGLLEQAVAGADLRRARPRRRRPSAPTWCGAARSPVRRSAPLTWSFQLTRRDSSHLVGFSRVEYLDFLKACTRPSARAPTSRSACATATASRSPTARRSASTPRSTSSVELGENVELLRETSDEYFGRAEAAQAARRPQARHGLHRRHAPRRVRAARLHRRRAAVAVDGRDRLRRHPPAHGRGGRRATAAPAPGPATSTRCSASSPATGRT